MSGTVQACGARRISSAEGVSAKDRGPEGSAARRGPREPESTLPAPHRATVAAGGRVRPARQGLPAGRVTLTPPSLPTARGTAIVTGSAVVAEPTLPAASTASQRR